MCAKNARQSCALVVIADGFEETEAIVILSSLRRAGLCAKSVGLTSGLVSSARGIQLMPDTTLTDLHFTTRTAYITAVILPAGSQSLARLEADPRVHRLLSQVLAQHGQIATSHEGLRVLRAAQIWINELEDATDGQRMPVILRRPQQSLETFAQDLVQSIKRPQPLDRGASHQILSGT